MCILEFLWQCAPYGSKVYVSLELNFASGKFHRKEVARNMIRLLWDKEMRNRCKLVTECIESVS
jgi:hypothetical protein